jgi:hypothetical protein
VTRQGDGLSGSEAVTLGRSVATAKRREKRAEYVATPRLERPLLGQCGVDGRPSEADNAGNLGNRFALPFRPPDCLLFLDRQQDAPVGLAARKHLAGRTGSRQPRKFHRGPRPQSNGLGAIVVVGRGRMTENSERLGDGDAATRHGPLGFDAAGCAAPHTWLLASRRFAALVTVVLCGKTPAQRGIRSPNRWPVGPSDGNVEKTVGRWACFATRAAPFAGRVDGLSALAGCPAFEAEPGQPGIAGLFPKPPNARFRGRNT